MVDVNTRYISNEIASFGDVNQWGLDREGSTCSIEGFLDPNADLFGGGRRPISLAGILP